MIRILLVDDQKSIRERLKSLLETEPDFDIVGMVDNGYDAIEQVKLLLPDVVLMDMEMPDIDGILATRIIAHSSIKTKVLVLSSYDSDEYVARSIYSGANGYILKGAPAEEIRDAIRFVNRGYMQIAPGLFERFIPNQNADRLGERGKPFKSLERRDFPAGLELTGLNLVRAADPSSIVPNPDRDRSSELIVDVTAQTSQKSVGWYQAAALVLAGLGLTTSLYFLRQGLHKPTETPNPTERSERLHELPFTGKIEPSQSVVVNATTPGLIDRVQVNIGQTVNVGGRLLTMRNLDAERTNQAKIEQHRQQAALQQQAAFQQATQQQQQAIQQQQILMGEQQAAADRISTNQQAIANYQRNLAPLHSQIAAANIQVTEANQEPSLLKQKRTTIDRAKAIYDRNVTAYQRLAKYQTAGAISQERVEQAEKELAIAKSDLDLAQEDYDRTIVAAQTATTKQAAQDRAVRLQQQLILKEQAGQLQQLQAQLRVAQSDYQQISNRLQQLQQQKFAPASPKSPPTQPPGLEPTTIEITAPIAGTVIELPISIGDRVYTGNKLLGIANLQQLKVGLDLDPAQATLLKSGQRALVKVGTGIDSQESTGSIAKIAPSPTAASTTHRIEVEFTNPKPTLLVGQIGTVYFPK